ncbi:MAG: UvrB/UvrC motif-containing protein [Planctomycetes bacterium]|nr:UvrB/UvrC motif-containing protein [Planctomycetota bacterium]
MSLVCDNCQEAKATVHITDTIPEKRERHLCKQCAEREGVLIKQTHQTTADILQEFIKHKAGVGEMDDKSCPQCGMTFREFRMKGQLGCPHDYEAFRSFLLPLIERAHNGGSHHVGKVPGSAGSDAKHRTELTRLRRELDEAVRNEQYEDAARIRDRMHILETEVSETS